MSSGTTGRRAGGTGTFGVSHALRRAAILAALAVSGCGDPTGGVAFNAPLHPVKGKVILPDGQPLTDGAVTFIPLSDKGYQAGGKVKQDGSFTLSTKTQDDGAAEGEYAVRVESPLTKPGAKKGVVEPVVPKKYAEEDLSGIKVTIKAGQNDLEPFKLDNKPPAKAAVGRDRDRD